MSVNNTDILNVISNSVIDDYYTAAIKSEVILDMLITPVITDLIGIAKDEEFKYITKEFPLVTGDSGFSSAKADYLLCNKENVYLVELKTSVDSVDTKQIKRYEGLYDTRFYIETDADKELNGNSSIGNWFIKLVKEKLIKECQTCGIIQGKGTSSKDITEKELAEQIFGGMHLDKKEDVQNYIQKRSKRGTIKYLTQINQIASSKEDLKDKLVKVYYLIPKATSSIPDEFDVILFPEIIRKWNHVKKDFLNKLTDSSRYDYIDWLITEVLAKLFPISV